MPHYLQSCRGSGRGRPLPWLRVLFTFPIVDFMKWQVIVFIFKAVLVHDCSWTRNIDGMTRTATDDIACKSLIFSSDIWHHLHNMWSRREFNSVGLISLHDLPLRRSSYSSGPGSLATKHQVEGRPWPTPSRPYVLQDPRLSRVPALILAAMTVVIEGPIYQQCAFLYPPTVALKGFEKPVVHSKTGDVLKGK